MSALTVIIDPGNFSTKFVYRWKGEIQSRSFYSIAHRYEQMEKIYATAKIKRVKFERFDYYIGEDAKRFYPNGQATYLGNTKKGHHEGIIRVIAALHEVYRETNESSFNIVITSPYESIRKDKEFFEKKLAGQREAIVNDELFSFSINNLRVMAEGLGAASFACEKDCVILDAGSMTMNVLCLIDGAINVNRSKTLNGGTIKHDEFALAEKFAKENTDVEYDQPILVVGGRNQAIAEALKDIGYENVEAVVIQDFPAYFINVLGLFKTFERKLEVMFS